VARVLRRLHLAITPGSTRGTTARACFLYGDRLVQRGARALARLREVERWAASLRSGVVREAFRA
jgi:hypothetical protein